MCRLISFQDRLTAFGRSITGAYTTPNGGVKGSTGIVECKLRVEIAMSS